MPCGCRHNEEEIKKVEEDCEETCENKCEDECEE